MSQRPFRVWQLSAVALIGLALWARFRGLHDLVLGALWVLVVVQSVITVVDYLESRRSAQPGGLWGVARVVGVLNVLAFFIISVSLGGTALLGGVRDGSYYLGDHGRLTEVSKATYWYSSIHGWSQAVTLPLGILGSLFRASRPRSPSDSLKRTAA
jgi:hypothetical protein